MSYRVDGVLSHQGVAKSKSKYSPSLSPSPCICICAVYKLLANPIPWSVTQACGQQLRNREPQLVYPPTPTFVSFLGRRGRTSVLRGFGCDPVSSALDMSGLICATPTFCLFQPHDFGLCLFRPLELGARLSILLFLSRDPCQPCAEGRFLRGKPVLARRDGLRAQYGSKRDRRRMSRRLWLSVRAELTCPAWSLRFFSRAFSL